MLRKVVGSPQTQELVNSKGLAPLTELTKCLTLLSSQRILWKMSVDIQKYHTKPYMANHNETKFIIIRIILVSLLIHWGRVMHICVIKLTIIGSDNGLLPGRHQTIIWTNDGILLRWPLWTNFSEILIGIQTFSFKKMHLKMSSAKWCPFCLGLNVLRNLQWYMSQHESQNCISCRKVDYSYLYKS